MRCQKLGITHLIFADNLFLLSGAICESLTILKHVLDDFGAQSGLGFNILKHNMFVTRVDDTLKADLTQCIGMEIKDLPIRYLGVLSISTRLRVRDSDDIKRKIFAKIQY